MQDEQQWIPGWMWTNMVTPNSAEATYASFQITFRSKLKVTHSGGFERRVSVQLRNRIKNP